MSREFDRPQTSGPVVDAVSVWDKNPVAGFRREVREVRDLVRKELGMEPLSTFDEEFWLKGSGLPQLMLPGFLD